MVSGTSFAAAFVSGAVALAIEQFPKISVDEQRKKLQKSSTDLGKAGI